MFDNTVIPQNVNKGNKLALICAASAVIDVCRGNERAVEIQDDFGFVFECLLNPSRF